LLAHPFDEFGAIDAELFGRETLAGAEGVFPTEAQFADGVDGGHGHHLGEKNTE